MHRLLATRGQKTRSLTSIICLALSLSSGCATIIRGPTQAVAISSEPNGADILVDGSLVGTTPSNIDLARGRDHLITFEKDGYHTRNIPVIKSIGRAVFGNLLYGGFLGWGVDATSGAQYNLNPETLVVQLIPLDEEEPSEEDENESSTFITRLNELDQMRESNRISEEEYSRMRLSVLEQYYPESVQ